MWARHLNDIMLVHNAQQLVAAECISYLTIVRGRATALWSSYHFCHPFADGRLQLQTFSCEAQLSSTKRQKSKNFMHDCFIFISVCVRERELLCVCVCVSNWLMERVQLSRYAVSCVHFGCVCTLYKLKLQNSHAALMKYNLVGRPGRPDSVAVWPYGNRVACKA